MAPKSLCLITALAPVPAFLGGSCPLGCSLSAPATGGCSVFSLQCNMYTAGSEKEKRAPGPLHGGTIAQLFVFCNGGVAGALPGRMVLLWRAPSISGGSDLACAVVPPAHPPTFLETGGLPLYPRRGLRPLHPAWGNGGIGRFLACPQGRGISLEAGVGWGEAGGLMVADADSRRRSGLATVRPLLKARRPWESSRGLLGNEALGLVTGQGVEP